MVETIPVEAVPACPLCGGAGPIAIRGARDSIFESPGSWTFRRCTRCGSLWLDPRPVRSALPLLYPGGYYTHSPSRDALAPPRGAVMRLAFSLKLALVESAFGYAGLSRRAPYALVPVARGAQRLPLAAHWAGHFVRFVPYRAHGRLLDVGSGNGTFMRLMQELGWEAVGIEPDAGSARPAREAGLDVIEAPLEDVALTPQHFDAITLSHVLEHFTDAPAVLARLAAALRPGGVVVSISPNPAALFARLFGPSWRGLEPPRHFALPSRLGYAYMLAPLGFSRVQLWTSARTASWMGCESLSIRQTRRITGYRGKAAPRALALASRLSTLVARGLGEEVVCVATKSQ